jgi:serine/threonine protein kinase
VIGKRLGNFEIEEKIGAGGMGEVYRARDTRLDRIVAIKILPPGVATDPRRRERFQREAQALSRLNHPHVCTLYDVGKEGDVDFLVMEHLEGTPLSDRLAAGALPPDEALAVSAQIADGLDAAHRAGVVHRDLKPANVMLTRSGAKILDFGLAKEGPGDAPAGSAILTATVDTPGSSLTEEGTILGTLQYMSPEQLHGEPADARSDLFSFGAMLYEMVAGDAPFAGKSQASVIASILEREPTSLITTRPDRSPPAGTSRRPPGRPPPTDAVSPPSSPWRRRRWPWPPAS